MRSLLFSLCAFAFGVPSHALGGPPGQLTFLENCPGDKLDNAVVAKDEGLFTLLLTPLLTGAINQGLKAVGTHLKDIASEKQVDVLHAGTYFYRATGEQINGPADLTESNDIELRSRCVLLTSRGTANIKGRTLTQLSAGYHASTYRPTGNGGRQITAWTPAGAALGTKLGELGYSDASRPGLVVVFDLELASVAGAARLVPRFVVLDHSIREKTADGYERDMTVELSLRLPGGTAPFAKMLTKFEGLKIGNGVRRMGTESGIPDPQALASTQLSVTGDWFSLPALDTEAAARVTAVNEAHTALKSNRNAFELAGAEAIALQTKLKQPPKPQPPPKPGAPKPQQPPPTPIPNDIPVDGGVPSCAGKDINRKAWLNAAQELQILSVATPKDEPRIAERTKAVAYFESCAKYNDAKAAKLDKRFKRRKAGSTQQAEPLLVFDADAQVKEFRKRPVAEFFGNLLTDDTTRGGLTTALVGAVDPGTRAAAGEKEATAALATKAAYEAALVAAELAQVAHSTAKDDAKAGALIDMEAKRRAANRLAEQLKIGLPYPSSGTWLSPSPPAATS